MNDPVAMCPIERRTDLDSVPKGLIDTEGPLTQSRCQGFAIDVFHDKERRPVLLADVVERADVGMAQLADEPGFPLETLASFRISREGSRQHLDGRRPTEARVDGLVDLAHASPAELGLDPVRPYLLPCLHETAADSLRC